MSDLTNDYRMALYALFPPGDCWPEEPGDFPEFDKLVEALIPGVVDAHTRAQALIVEARISESTELLENWEQQYGLPDQYSEDGETIDQRRANVLAKRRKKEAPNIHKLQLVVEQYMPGAILNHRLHPNFAAGEGWAGAPCGDSEQAVWDLEYMINLIPLNYSSFQDWDLTGSATILEDQEGTPTSQDSESLTVDYVDVSAGTATVSVTLDGIEQDGAGTEVYCSVWIKSPDGTPRDVQIQYLKRDNTLSTAQTYIAVECWGKATYTAEIGAGATVPELRITCLDVGQTALVDAFAGERYPLREGRVRTLFPLNTEGNMLVIGEYSSYVIDSDGDLVVGDDDFVVV